MLTSLSNTKLDKHIMQEHQTQNSARVENYNETKGTQDEPIISISPPPQESHNRLQAQARELAGRNGKLFRTETRLV